jgi:hypothetical protein
LRFDAKVLAQSLVSRRAKEMLIMQIMLLLKVEQTAHDRGPSYIDLDATKMSFSAQSECAEFLFSENAKSIDLFHRPSALQTAPFLLRNVSRRFVRQPLIS